MCHTLSQHSPKTLIPSCSQRLLSRKIQLFSSSLSHLPLHYQIFLPNRLLILKSLSQTLLLERVPLKIVPLHILFPFPENILPFLHTHLRITGNPLRQNYSNFNVIQIPRKPYQNADSDLVCLGQELRF